MTIDDCTISGSSAFAGGGGIYNTGTLTIDTSTISGNWIQFVIGMGGGGIYNTGTLTIDTSSISGNRHVIYYEYWFSGVGGGISNGGTLTIDDCTISGNSSRLLWRRHLQQFWYHGYHCQHH